MSWDVCICCEHESVMDEELRHPCLLERRHYLFDYIRLNLYLVKKLNGNHFLEADGSVARSHLWCNSSCLCYQIFLY